MLVLSRKERQHIKLGDSIVITIVRVNRDKVRLGIEAPGDLRVLRGELDEFPEVDLGEEQTDEVAACSEGS